MSLSEIGLIVIVVLIVMGPEKLPEVMKFVGKGVREVRKASNMMRDAMMVEETVTKTFTSNISTSYEAPEPPPRIDYRDFVRTVTLGDQNGAEDIEWIAMKGRQRDHELHREVYLHIPYEETLGG
jgi:Sec-independent protein translocase protein TatA